MKRFIDRILFDWKEKDTRKPLLLRGARQVGKTHAVRELGKSFEGYVEINFEVMPRAKAIFEKDLAPERITQELSLITEKKIVPGKTLLFFDEVQAAPNVIIALRYFYEMMPDLHVIAAGSLLDFAIQAVGIPVGRVVSLYMYPMTFIEFLYALGHELLAAEIMRHTFTEPIALSVHEKALELLGYYLAIGGMPEVVACFKETKNALECALILHTLIDTYRQDFGKYAQEFQVKYVDLLFNYVPRLLGQRFRYSAIEGDYRKRELAPALDLLVMAGIVHSVVNTGAHGTPLGAEADRQHFKAIFIDVALAQAILGVKISEWILNPLEAIVNKGALVESFVGQELLGYSYPYMKERLYYWQRQSRGSQAEVDYVIQENELIIPIEVKGGKSSTLLSMHAFLNSHQSSPFGLRFSVRNYAAHEKIRSYPLYAIAAAIGGPSKSGRLAL